MSAGRVLGMVNVRVVFFKVDSLQPLGLEVAVGLFDVDVVELCRFLMHY
jgi:hypothetical protein